MKRIHLIILTALALVLLVSAFGQTPQPKAIKRVEVTAQTIAKLPAGKPLLIDLTRPGTVYALAAGIDYNRVRVRTSTGEKAMSDLVKQLGIKQFGTSGTLGMSSDGMLAPPVGGTSRSTGSGISQYDCSYTSKCDCTGFSDCLRLQLDGKCKGEWYCNGPHHSECYCMKKA